MTRSQQSSLGIVLTSQRYSFTRRLEEMANETSNGCITTNGLAENFGSEEALKFAKKLYIHGGNISNWNRIKRKTTPSSADEVSAQSIS